MTDVAIDDRVTVTDPGMYPDMPADTYHADPVPEGSLSSTGARTLLAAPALFRHHQDHPAPPNPTFDLGHAAHRLVLGDGPELTVIDADSWARKTDREARDDAYAHGHVPLLKPQYEQATAMADALWSHPIAAALLRPGTGSPEVSLFWRDQPTGVWRRARPDWLPHAGSNRLIICDYKTTASADPDTLGKHVANYGYHQQAAWYLDGVRALELADDPAFVFIFQEKTPPYLVTVTELDVDALDWGQRLNRKAINRYYTCRDQETWPGYADDVVLTSLPRWASHQYETAHAAGDL